MFTSFGMRQTIAFTIAFASCFLIVPQAQAKFPPKIKEVVYSTYPPAKPQRAL